MKLLRFATFAVALVACLLADAQSSAKVPTANDTAPSGNPVVARGKGFEIRRRELDQVLAAVRARSPKDELPPDAAIHALTQLIEIQLVLNKATDAEKAEGKKNAADKIADIGQTMSAAEIEQRLQASHMTADELRLKFSQEMTAQASLARQLGIQVTDADAKKIFDNHPEAYDQPAKAHVRELLLLTTSDFSTSAAPPLPAATIQAKRKQIDELLKRIRAGEDFAALAKKYNEDPISKDVGGEFSFIKEQMGFGDLAFTMKPNQISDVLTDEDGFRIVQLLEIIPARKAELAAVVGQIKIGLSGAEKQRRAPAYIKQLREDSGVEILDAGLKAAMAANDAEMAANAKKAAEAQAAATAKANTPAQKEAEAQVFGPANNRPPVNP